MTRLISVLLQCSHFFTVFTGSGMGRRRSCDRCHTTKESCCYHGNCIGFVAKRPVFGFPTKSETKQAVHLQKMATVVKFQI